jgi:thioredoxin reductase
MTESEVIIVGGGAAGLSAALVLSRARRDVVVIDAGEPRNAPASHMHGFLSRDGLPPRELLAIARHEVEAYGGRIRDGHAETATRRADGGFQVALEGGASLTGRKLLIATGLRDELPEITGLAPRFGRDVLHCPYCHGHEVRDLPLGVLGGAANSLHQAQLVRQWSPDVVFFNHTGRLTSEEREELEARAIGIVDEPVTGLVVEADQLAGIRLADGSVVPRMALFVAPRFVANNAVLSGLGCDLDADGRPVTDPTGRTTVPGLWVAGNVSNPRAQVITAAAEGSAAAIALHAELVTDDVARAVAAYRSTS